MNKGVDTRVAWTVAVSPRLLRLLIKVSIQSLALLAFLTSVFRRKFIRCVWCLLVGLASPTHCWFLVSGCVFIFLCEPSLRARLEMGYQRKEPTWRKELAGSPASLMMMVRSGGGRTLTYLDTGAVWFFWGVVSHPSACPASLTQEPLLPLKQDTGGTTVTGQKDRIPINRPSGTWGCSLPGSRSPVLPHRGPTPPSVSVSPSGVF